MKNGRRSAEIGGSNMPVLSNRTADFTDSVIRRMTRISNRYGAVNLSQGFPDFEPPKEILDRLALVTMEDFHQYSITWGAQNFREALAEIQTAGQLTHDHHIKTVTDDIITQRAGLF